MLENYTIYVGADHRGFEKKSALIEMIRDCHENVAVEDLGAFSLDPEDDFNDCAVAVAEKIQSDPLGTGVLICGSAHGVTMQANRFRGVRAINVLTAESAVAGKADDYANVVCLSADQLDVDQMEQIVKAFCHARPKTETKYQRRAERLDEYGS